MKKRRLLDTTWKKRSYLILGSILLAKHEVPVTEESALTKSFEFDSTCHFLFKRREKERKKSPTSDSLVPSPLLLLSLLSSSYASLQAEAEGVGSERVGY